MMPIMIILAMLPFCDGDYDDNSGDDNASEDNDNSRSYIHSLLLSSNKQG